MFNGVGGFSVSSGVAQLTTNLKFGDVDTYIPLTSPTNLPVSLDLVKNHLKIPLIDTSQDAYLTLLIQAATKIYEDFTSNVLITTSFKYYSNCFRQSFELIRYPLRVFTSFSYIDSDENVIVFPNTLYQVTDELRYFRVIILDPTSFPDDKFDKFQAINLEFDSGYGSDDTTVPPDIKFGLLHLIAFLNENRGDCSICDKACEDSSILPQFTQQIISKYRVASVFGAPFRG